MDLAKSCLVFPFSRVNGNAICALIATLDIHPILQNLEVILPSIRDPAISLTHKLTDFDNVILAFSLFSTQLEHIKMKITEYMKIFKEKNIIIVAGHYKEIDERVREKFATDEISIGNFVLTGGELPASIITDAIVRLIPGVLNDSESALNDSFQNGNTVEAPCYTRPAEYEGMKVPEVLLSGNKKEIDKWKDEQSLSLTKKWKKLNKNGEYYG